MSGLIDQVIGQLGSGQVEAIAKQLGTDPQTAQAAIEQALPLIVGGMAKNASTPEGAGALHSALERDHAGTDISEVLGGVLGNAGGGAGGVGGLLGSLLGGGPQGAPGGLGAVIGSVLGGGQQQSGVNTGIGGAILGHIFGNNVNAANQGLGQTTGLGAQNAGQLLAILAPIVMSVLANQSRSQGLSPGGLGNVLTQQAQTTQQQGGITGGLLNAVLDHNGDGHIDLSEMIQAAGGLMGALGGRRTV
ncbi:MAG: DUF937 domain-containing protein [Rudaea sp.]|uniref:DUF937 domain-containing protein n=1 Tax=unclassified Rudaea TaxID=2627037 RepID=UPI0010FA3F8E|nr:MULTISPECIES: DUF937 domain-containing protein [unclassified Rudaea]MBN8885745.1 DUF937 domain-containing protein [Rudaea sp.]